ncbi:MAG: hypothetical protein ACK5JT_05845 [Hyphomicrobiaceae bacterium]
MSRIELAATLENGARPHNGNQRAQQVQPPALPGQQRSLHDALVGLGPGRPLPPPHKPGRQTPAAPATAPEALEGTEASATAAPEQATQAPASPEAPYLDLETPFSMEMDQAYSGIFEDNEPPPIVIERARTEQRTGVPAARAAARPTLWLGMSVGFCLSLVVGAGLYVVLNTA